MLELVDRALENLERLYERFERPAVTLEPDEFRAPRGAWVLVDLGGRPVASGGLCRHEDGASVAELKRIWVEPEVRGRGLSRVLLGALEVRAVELGYSAVHLATGSRQPEAMRLYETSGYEVVARREVGPGRAFVTSYAKSLVPERPARIASRSSR
ncbi:MAG: GNAT family N-acetyltransferase [Actinomycetota bacterium]|nr:GNAT family N-acetyltransferase [Actinomycetota bacterium]